MEVLCQTASARRRKCFLSRGGRRGAAGAHLPGQWPDLTIYELSVVTVVGHNGQRERGRGRHEIASKRIETFRGGTDDAVPSERATHMAREERDERVLIEAPAMSTE